MGEFFEAILVNLVTSAVGAFIGFLAGRLVLNRIEERRFGGWRVIIHHPDGHTDERPIGLKKARELLDDVGEQSVYLKGLVSPFAWVNCDLVTEGRRIGLLVEDGQARTFTIDLSKNPERVPAAARG